MRVSFHRSRSVARLLVFPSVLLLLGVPSAAETPAVFDGLLDGERVNLPLDELVARAALEPGQAFRVVEIGRDAHSSHHAVAIRDREQPHRHDHHDLFVVMLAGHGSMLLGDDERLVGEGSVLYVPRGTVHAFRNASGSIAYAYAVYSPAFDGEDRVVVPDE